MKTAKIISILGHPIFHPTWMMIILLLSGLTRFTSGNEAIFLIVTLSMTCVLPALIMALMKKWNIIGSLEMEDRDDRLGPLFIMILFLYATLRFFNRIQLLSVFSLYLTTIIAATILAFIITFFWKISLHALGWGCFTASLFLMTMISDMYMPYFIGSIIISGIVASARLKLKSHSNAQIFTGFTMGFAIVIITYCFYLL